MRILISVLACALLAGSARGDNHDDAKAAFQHGTALYGLHRFAEAAVAFERAFELTPEPANLYNAAQAHRFAGNKTRAADLYESYLRLYPNQSNIGEVRGHIKQLRAAIETERQATNAPPHEMSETTRPSEPPPTETAPLATTPSNAPAAMVATSPAPEKPKRRWVWGVVGGAAVVVAVTAIALGVTLGAPAKSPKASYGTIDGN